MNQDGSRAEASGQRSSKAHMEALANDDIDAAVEVILSRENYIIQELNKYLEHQDFLNERRKEMLHKRWVENVACPLQQKIIEKVGSPREIAKRKHLEREGYQRFRDIMCWLVVIPEDWTGLPVWGWKMPMTTWIEHFYHRT